jgi:hypothetical protein
MPGLTIRKAREKSFEGLRTALTVCQERRGQHRARCLSPPDGRIACSDLRDPHQPCAPMSVRSRPKRPVRKTHFSSRFNRIASVQRTHEKYFLLISENQYLLPPVPPHCRGASRPSRTLKRDAMDASGDARRASPARTAKSCGPGLPTLRPSSQKLLLSSGLAGDGSKKARFPGRSRISRKTIAQGRPVVRLNLW